MRHILDRTILPMVSRKRHVAVVMDLNWPFRRHYEVSAGIRDYTENHCDWSLDLGNFPHCELAHGRRYDGIVGRIDKDCLLAVRRAKIPVVNVWADSPVGVAFPCGELCHAVSIICRASGWKIPEELAMVGAGNEQLICNVADPTLSSIDGAAWN